ncbi:apolipoprotein L1-like isoform X5 [Channa argus]|uniref:apolipoprotein L1-like isoform X5 n=1 Tax=Channa argus TaxID=215402 RepID=UPI00352007DC
MDRYQNLDLELECDGGAAAQKTVLLKGMFKRSSKSAEPPVQTQDSLSADGELSKTDDSLTANSNTKATVLLKSATRSASNDSLTDSNKSIKESVGVFSGMFKQFSKPFGVRTQSQDNLSAPTELSRSKNNHSGPGKTKNETEEDTVMDKESVKQVDEKPKLAAPEDEGLEVDKPSSKEEKKEEESKEKTETNVRKPKRHNPFMPRVKAKVTQKDAQERPAGNSAETEVGNRSLFEQLDDFRIYPAKPDSRDAENLMEWWNTVESWEDTPQEDVMTEKEEATAFAVTADKVQKGIRVFNKLFSERAETLWQHVIDLNSIADALDKFNKNTKIAQITGGSTSALGGIATIAGLALAPVTMGTSLIVTAVGLGVATAGGLTSAGAGISNQVNNSMDRKKVEKLVEDYQEKIGDLNKCLEFIQQGIENLRKFDLIKMKKRAYNRDFPALSSSLYEDGAMAGKAIVSNANEIMRVVQIAHMAGSTAAKAVQIASMATGVLTGLFVGMDLYFVAKDSKELKKGAKSEFAAKIREVATQLHDGLVELNGIRVELQSTTQGDRAAADGEKTQKDNKYSEEEDEIKHIKKDVEN